MGDEAFGLGGDLVPFGRVEKDGVFLEEEGREGGREGGKKVRVKN